MLDPNMWAAAGKVADSAIKETMGGANQATATASMGGNITFGGSGGTGGGKWLVPSLIAGAVLLALVFTRKK